MSLSPPLFFLLLACLYVWNLIYYVVVILAVEWEKWDGAEEKAEKKSDVYVIDKKNCVLNNKSSSVVEKQERKNRLADQLECLTMKLPTNQAIKDVPMFLFFSFLPFAFLLLLFLYSTLQDLTTYRLRRHYSISIDTSKFIRKKKIGM